MNVIYNAKKAIITTTPVNAALIFDCGQAFRFDPYGDSWRGVAYGRELTVTTDGCTLTLDPCTPEDFENIWRGYFDLDFDYPSLEQSLCTDPVFAAALPYCPGMRVLRQDNFETLISFIISANNNISRIKKIIAAICKACGKHINENAYAFPDPGALAAMTEEQLCTCGTGYRAPYIKKTATAIADGSFDLSAPAALPYNEAKKLLMTLTGVGPKVADCVLLYSYQMRSAFPKDVWIHRVLRDLYGVEFKGEAQLCDFVVGKFGDNAGIAQQYLFHYARIAAK